MHRVYTQEMTPERFEKLSPRIRKAIDELMETRTIYPDGPKEIVGGAYDDVDLYWHFKGPWMSGLCDVINKSTFSLPQEVLVRVKNKILPSLSNGERNDIEGIGKTMREFINKDLEFISKTYYW